MTDVENCRCGEPVSFDVNGAEVERYNYCDNCGRAYKLEVTRLPYADKETNGGDNE